MKGLAALARTSYFVRRISTDRDVRDTKYVIGTGGAG